MPDAYAEFNGLRPMTDVERARLEQRIRARAEAQRDARGETYWHGLMHAFGTNNPEYRRCPVCG